MNVSHDFHIPVMGIGFSIDTPIKVAPFGIDSAISLASHNAIEIARKSYANLLGEKYDEIKPGSEDAAARRTKDYLNTVNRIVDIEFEKIKQQSFSDEGNHLNKTFLMLAKSHPARKMYDDFKSAEIQEISVENELRASLRKGSIDVNIMTKLQNPHYKSDDAKFNENMSALCGFAESELESSVIFSAGIHPGLYSYISKFEDFLPDENGKFKKKVILKVSDYRSMATQGKFLAKKGVWVSEYRIESGLNCGGHAFGSPDGWLAGPILAEVMKNREDLDSEVLGLYRTALGNQDINPERAKITYQGGVKTHEELQYFLDNGAVKVGVATPWLNVPEVTNVSDSTLELLMNAREGDVQLSNRSPFGIPFWYLIGTDGDLRHATNIEDSDFGVVCTYQHLRRPIDGEIACYADKNTMKAELAKIEDVEDVQKKEYLTRKILEKQCLCTSLTHDMRKKHDIEETNFVNTTDEVICPSPSIAYFDGEYTLLQMARHLNGEESVLSSVPPNGLMEELRINVERTEYLMEKRHFKDDPEAIVKLSNAVIAGLQKGIEFYRNNIGLLPSHQHDEITQKLNLYEGKLAALQN